MATAFCPECEEKVTLPSASQEATVQCPLCDAEFGLAVLLESIPPTLLVVDDPAVESAEDVASDEESADVGFSLEALMDQPEGFSIDDEKATVRATTVRSSGRQASKGGGFRSVMQVIFGGLLALPLAQLALWYWPWGPQDPLKLGPEISSYAVSKWMVPARFHGSTDETSDDDFADELDLEPEINRGFDFDGKFDGFDSNTRNNPTLGNETADGFGAARVLNGQNVRPNAQPTNPTLDELSNGKPDEVVYKPVPLSPTDYVRGAAVYRTVVLQAMLQRAQQQSDKWNGLATELGEKQRQIENGNMAWFLGQLATSFTFHDSRDETATVVMGEIFEFFQESAIQQELLDVLDVEFGKTLENSTEPIQGAVFTATVAAATNVNGYRQAEMTLNESDTKVPLVFSPQLSPEFEPDQTYLIVGSLVSQPRRVLQNYLGLSDSVVVLGTYLPLSVNVADAGQ
ncbi:MAG: hypothetical protein HOB73_13060 [Planctomycetaceae bacterium]|jgi:hypothetical protein|nr:hypothetical protein [Planctomycetaceae bacterium]